MKYRKKPVVIEAIQFFNGDGKNTIKDCLSFIKGIAFYSEEKEGIIIRTLEGEMLANDGDFIIRGVSNEYYPCKPDIFEKTYERVEE